MVGPHHFNFNNCQNNRMAGVVKIIQSVSAANNSALTEFLQAVEEGQGFRSSSDSPDALVQHLTSLLNKVTTRETGLLLLEVFLKQCTLDTLSQKGPLWATFCIKACYGKTSTGAASRAYDCLALLASKSKDVPELSKAFTGHLLVKISETLPTAPHWAPLSALKCIEECLQALTGPCTPIRNSIEKYALSFLDSFDSRLVASSGRCLHLLQQIKGGSNVNLNTKTAWEQHQFRLVGSLHEVLDTIFANFPETYDEEPEIERLKIRRLHLSNEPVQRAAQCLVRFKNLLSYLLVALQESYPVPKLIAPKKILNLISRGLAINSIMAEKSPISDNLAIGALLPEMHVQLLKLMDVLILTLRLHMALWAKTILRFVTDTLKWTFTGKSVGFPKPYRKLRIAAYNTLRLWCTVMRSGSLCELVAETIFEQIESDISPFQTEVTLQVLSGARKHMSKKARRQLHKTQNERSNMAQNHSKTFNSSNTRKTLSDEDNGELCAAALQCFKQVIQAATIFVKPTVIKDVQETVFSLCAELPGSSCSKDKLYWSSNCRKALYEVVFTLITSPHHLCPPPGALAVGLLRIGQFSDPSNNVRDTCSELLGALEKIAHPQKECLFFPSNVEEIRNAFKKYNRKRDMFVMRESSPEDDEDNQRIPEIVIVIGKQGQNIDLALDEDEDNSHLIPMDQNEPINLEDESNNGHNQEEVIEIEDESADGNNLSPGDDPVEIEINEIVVQETEELDISPEEPATKKICLREDIDLSIEATPTENKSSQNTQPEKPFQDTEPEKPSQDTEPEPERPSEGVEPDDNMLLESITATFINELKEGSNE